MNLHHEAINDLHDDCEILAHIATSQLYYLKTARFQLEKSLRFINPAARKFTQTQINRLIHILDIYRDKLLKLRFAKSPAYLRTQLENAYQYLRTSGQLTGALITATDWQSPSFSHSISSMAGRWTGKITGTVNDYKRDHHHDEKEYERRFVKEYVDVFFKLNYHAYLTNSGQAAFTTILAYLHSEGKLNGKIIMGINSYFQYKHILVKSYKDQIVQVNENDTRSIYYAIRKYKPCALFLDSLSNAATIPVPDLKTIYQTLSKYTDKETYFIVDNTCLGPAFQAFNLKGGSSKIRIIFWESLNKYHQFGMDRVTAGIVVVKGHDAGGIFEYRKHAGTNITDASVYALPLPDRKLLTIKLLRHQRNADVLIKYLRSFLAGSRAVEEVVYPQEKLPFRGSFFNLKLNPRFRNRRAYERIIQNVLDSAKKKNAQITAGTTFGLPTTRIYLTSLWDKYGEPFLRVSVGTEDRNCIERVKDVLSDVLLR